MSYRSLKRVLGESNLARKFRYLFGLFLVVVLLLAFLSVYWTTTRLVYDTTRRKARDLADIALLKQHFIQWERNNLGHKELVSEMIEGLSHEPYEYAVLDFSGNLENYPRDDWEKEKLNELFDLAGDTLPVAGAGAEGEANSDGPAVPLDPSAFKTDVDTTPIFRERIESGKYSYYQPVAWKQDCSVCHPIENPLEGVLPASESAGRIREGYLGDDMTFSVVAISFPVGETEAAMRWLQAILITAGILTFFVAMVALWAVVRYVIVKPLAHLRNVSEEIGRGKTDLRAELQTGDEFEELAQSFNRMLRHLTEAQEELRDVNNNLDAKVDQLAQLNLQLYEMNKLKGEFLANMSHELRTPLNSIIGFSEVLQGVDSLNEKQKRYAANIQKSGRLLLEMINDILDFAKLEAGKMEVRPSEFHPDHVVASQCELIRPLTDEKNIDLEVHVESGQPPMYQDQGKVQQILTNLLSNAIKFTPEGGRITVNASRDAQGRLELTVADTGVGIADEDREIIFEKFRQAPIVSGRDRLAREYSGTGLGLSIVKESCKLLGGEVSFTSELGKGSTFKIVLPWTIADEPLRETEISSRIEELSHPRRGEFSPAETH
jgi:signal transduction histidine kinase